MHEKISPSNQSEAKPRGCSALLYELHIVWEAFKEELGNHGAVSVPIYEHSKQTLVKKLEKVVSVLKEEGIHVSIIEESKTQMGSDGRYDLVGFPISGSVESYAVLGVAEFKRAHEKTLKGQLELEGFTIEPLKSNYENGYGTLYVAATRKLGY